MFRVRKFWSYVMGLDKEPIKKEPKVAREFNIDEFNDWFNNECTSYDGRKGCAGIFLRLDKLSTMWICDYLEYIGQDSSYEQGMKYYDIVRSDWRKKLNG